MAEINTKEQFFKYYSAIAAVSRDTLLELIPDKEQQEAKAKEVANKIAEAIGEYPIYLGFIGLFLVTEGIIQKLVGSIKPLVDEMQGKKETIQ